MAEIYRTSDILIFPSRSETFGLVVVEAMGSGLHCLVSDSLKGTFDEFEERGFLEYVQLEEHSYISAIRSSIAKVESYRNNKFILSSLVKEKYDWALITKQLFKYFNEATSR